MLHLLLDEHQDLYESFGFVVYISSWQEAFLPSLRFAVKFILQKTRHKFSDQAIMISTHLDQNQRVKPNVGRTNGCVGLAVSMQIRNSWMQLHTYAFAFKLLDYFPIHTDFQVFDNLLRCQHGRKIPRLNQLVELLLPHRPSGWQAADVSIAEKRPQKSIDWLVKAGVHGRVWSVVVS